MNETTDNQVPVTHPKYQRKGAGSMLIKYGGDVADEQGVLCALTSSEAGHCIYTTWTRSKEITEMDLRPYGVDAVEMRRNMIRPAKQSTGHISTEPAREPQQVA